MHTNALVLGSIVTYRGTPYMALGYANGYVKIIAPHMGNAKLNVKRVNVVVTTCKATVVDCCGKRVLVTRKGTIVSTVSNRVLKNTTKDGKLMLLLADKALQL